MCISHMPCWIIYTYSRKTKYKLKQINKVRDSSYNVKLKYNRTLYCIASFVDLRRFFCALLAANSFYFLKFSLVVYFDFLILSKWWKYFSNGKGILDNFIFGIDADGVPPCRMLLAHTSILPPFGSVQNYFSTIKYANKYSYKKSWELLQNNVDLTSYSNDNCRADDYRVIVLVSLF